MGIGWAGWIEPIQFIGQGGGGYDPDAPILALDLWAGGGEGGWWHPGDPAVVFQDSAGTTPALNASPVRRINDKSPNGNNWIAPSDGARGVLNVSTQSWIKLDGVDDGYRVTTTLAAGMSAIIVMDRVTDTQWILGENEAGSLDRGFAVAAANGSPNYGSVPQVGTPVCRINGVSVGTTRQDLLNACPANTPVVLTVENLNLSTWAAFGILYSAFEFGGRLFEYILCPDQTSTKRNALEQALAARHGITL